MPVDRRDEDQRSEIDKREFTVNLIAVGFCILGVSRHQIPLVYGENQPLSTLKGIGQDLRILVGYPFGPIQEVNHQIPPVHGAEGPDHAIMLNPIVDSCLARIPAVSTRVYRWPRQMKGLSTASRVVPGRESTTERSKPRMRFTKVDLPTLGRPTIARRRGRTISSSSSTVTSLSPAGKALTTWSINSVRPSPCSADRGKTSFKPRS